MQTELKKKVFNWFCDNKNAPHRFDLCKKEFRQYIYKSDWSFCTGGEEVIDFINALDDLI